MKLTLNIYGFVGLVPFFFLEKVQFVVVVVLIWRGVWPYKYANCVLLVTNIYEFVGPP